MSRTCGGCKNILRFFTSYETRNDISVLSCLILTHKRVRSCACACNVQLVLSLKKKECVDYKSLKSFRLKNAGISSALARGRLYAVQGIYISLILT